MKLTDLLDQIDRLDQKSTPGKWVASKGTLKNREGWSIFVDEHNNTVTSATPGDAEFIALARTALPKLAEAVYHVLDLLDVVEKSDKYSYDFGGNKSPYLVTTNEVRRAITDAMGAAGVV